MKILIVWRNNFFHRSHRCIAVQGRLNSDPVYCEHKLGHTLTIEQILIILRLFQVGEYSYCFWRFSGFNFIQKQKARQMCNIKKGVCMVADLCYFTIWRIWRGVFSSVRYFKKKNITSNNTTKQLFAIFLPKKTKKTTGGRISYLLFLNLHRLSIKYS